MRATSGVCSVESTRWPVSAALSAMSIVSSSRISPSRITSGSWRSAARSARGEVGGVEPDLALAHVARASSCRNSIGSSIVTMCTRRVWLRWPIIAASVETCRCRPRPRRARARALSRHIARTTGGAPSSSNVGICERDAAQHDRERAALAVHVHAEASEARHRVRRCRARAASRARRGAGSGAGSCARAASRVLGPDLVDAEVDHVAAHARAGGWPTLRWMSLALAASALPRS